MKKLILTILSFLLGISLMAQAPNLISYQAVVRDASNSVINNTQIAMRVSILSDSEEGNSVYSETHTPTTNANGLVSIQIGRGTVEPESGAFADIDWGANSHFIKTEIDPAPVQNEEPDYSITGTCQLLSVPYALHAKTAENVTGLSDDLEERVVDLENNSLQRDENGSVGNLKVGNGGDWVELQIDGKGDNDWIFNAHNNSKNLHIRSHKTGQSLWSNVVMTLDRESGNVGIGNDNPSEKLDVDGNVYVNGNMNSKEVHTDVFYSSSMGEGFKIFGDKDYFGEHKDGIILEMIDRNRVEGNTDGGFVFRGYTSTDDKHSDWMVIKSEGKVGIGTDTPSAKLDVSGTANFSDRVEVNANFLADIITNKGADFKLGTDDGRDKGSVESQRALSHLLDDKLAINFDGDFEGGVVVQGESTEFESKVGIGIENTEEDVMLLVDGRVTAEEYKTEIVGPAPDYVFANDYDLITLSEIEAYITEHSHLPEIPSAKVMETEGVNLGEMSMSLLKKIEELTLYTIEQEKRIKNLESKNTQLASENQKLTEIAEQLLEMQKDIEMLKKQ